MKKVPAIGVLLLGCAVAAWPAPPAPLTTLRALRALTNAEADRALPVVFEATVTYYRNTDTDLFVQDDGAAIYVSYKAGAGLSPGDRVRVTGTTQGSLRPIVNAASVTPLHHGALPSPLPASFAQLVSAQLDCMRVRLRAVVRSADMAGVGDLRGIYLQVSMDDGYVDAAVNSTDESALGKLLDAEVEITGIATAKFDQRMQLSGSRIDVQSLADVRILKPAAAPSAAVPLAPLDNILGNYRVRDLSRRVRVQGTITYYQPGSTVVLQKGSNSLWIMTATSEPLRIGDLAEVTGFPEVRNGFSILWLAEIRDTHVQAPIVPVAVGWRELGFGGNAFNLVTTEGRVVRQVREAANDEYVLEADGHVFSAIYRHPPFSDWAHAAAMKVVPAGSKIRVTGIGMFYTPDPFNGPVATDVLLRSPDDIGVIGGPPLVSIRTLILMVSLLVAVVVIVGARGWAIEHKVGRQTVALAAFERQRSRILEDINGSRPLSEIVEEIAALVSMKMDGAPSWCQISDGARLGSYPANSTALRLAQVEIPARSGAPLGVIFAGLDPLSRPEPGEADALAMGAELATLAIETRRLYADLRHRSEFDLLTDIHNRGSLDGLLDAQIEKARQDADIFGLIYIDLDEFKLVNDLYGHQVGDLYLQEVASRMKRQLRSHDMLARLGGDEFAALVPVVRSRAEVEEIALRLEHCFDEAFAVEGYVLRGAASVGVALYPEDATTRDSLLSFADTAMYVAKHEKRRVPTAHGNPEATA